MAKKREPTRAKGGEVIIEMPASPVIYTAQEAFGLPPKKYRMCWIEVTDEVEEDDYQLGDDLDLSNVDQEWDELAKKFTPQQKELF